MQLIKAFGYLYNSLLKECEGYGGNEVSGDDEGDLGDPLPPGLGLEVGAELHPGLPDLGLGLLLQAPPTFAPERALQLGHRGRGPEVREQVSRIKV